MPFYMILNIKIFFAILGTSNSAYCLVCTHTSLDTPHKFLDDEISDMNSAHCLPVAFIPQGEMDKSRSNIMSAELEHVNAHLENGVLRITVPKLAA
ncbi:hypothetical protein WN944_005824 [Citrus x changshan-huyou]|uniref:SHSP domain-containing protein n=1 Tax=Citrus x changshan-huyou TaxID=2935761 RepID=A0AAP0QT65_9ROSI